MPADPLDVFARLGFVDTLADLRPCENALELAKKPRGHDDLESVLGECADNLVSRGALLADQSRDEDVRIDNDSRHAAELRSRRAARTSSTASFSASSSDRLDLDCVTSNSRPKEVGVQRAFDDSSIAFTACAQLVPGAGDDLSVEVHGYFLAV